MGEGDDMDVSHIRYGIFVLFFCFFFLFCSTG